MIDIHAHILPALDDGPKEMATALEMAGLAEKDGITTIIATPHVITGEFDLTKDAILEAVDNFNLEIKNSNLSLEILPGAENYLDLDLVQKAKDDKLMTLNNGGKYILVELPMQSFPAYAEQVFFELKLLGLTPILAHPERNLKLMENPELVYKLVTKGVLMQINATSLTGAFGNTVARSARLFLEHNWVHFLASDCHSCGTRGPRLTEARDLVSKLVGNRKATELILDNPQKVISGETIIANDFKDYTPNRGIWEKLKSKFL